MNISIHCFGQIRSLTKEKLVTLQIPSNSAITKALDSLVEKFGEEMEKLLYREGKIRDFYSVQVDKINVKNEDLGAFILKENQVIAIIPFIAGG